MRGQHAYKGLIKESGFGDVLLVVGVVTKAPSDPLKKVIKLA